MSMILVIRNADDIDSSVNAANDFLMHQRQNALATEPNSWVLGIWVRNRLDADLPYWPRFNSNDAGDAYKNHSVGVIESFGISGLWTLCRIAGTSFDIETNREGRRRTFLKEMMRNTSDNYPDQNNEQFFSVFSASDPMEKIREELAFLRDKHPPVSSAWFIDHFSEGIAESKERLLK